MAIKKFSELKAEDKPREILKEKGAEQLSDAQLMQILLGTGTKGKDVKKLSSEIWRLLSKKNYKIERADLEKVNGLGDAKISQILSCVELAARLRGGKHPITSVDPKEIWEKLADIRMSQKEHFIIFFLDSRNKEIAREVVSIGTVNASLVHPREVFSHAVKNNSASILGVHNHPSNDSEPSDADIGVTKRLVEAGGILGIEFVEHIIVTKDHYYSMKENMEDLFDE